MAKKSSRRIINNIDEVNIEIDYDKLADAIVKASEKQTQQHSVSREWMKYIMHFVFWGLAIISGILAIICFVYSGGIIINIESSSTPTDLNKLFIAFLVLIIGLFLLSVCFFTIFSAKEINTETDRNYIASLFSNVVALVALIVSLVALVKG